ncbi:pentapeptide repeat-containing protein [Desulfovibrio sp. JC022]|uniref:pentapeptide repeat-containing protein n=1 Tax=Desulfovibrio sp. JC022 TaxID=2593642 RepID=UPI0013D1B65E|nr:pentapeptide repeat-containing protein [Desulfovibrio sp. JC022]NDV22942.1 pentapeptide repeat-containing protein [Desulfovibrio sp. JC022]
MSRESYSPLVPALTTNIKEYSNDIAKEDPILYSWVQRDETAKYVGCDFSDEALRSCNISNAQFINCIFDEADLAESVFTECVFTDCSFIRANLYKVTFKGCTIESTFPGKDSPFVGAGMGHVKFIPLKTRLVRTSLVNLSFKQMGFRNGMFVRCVIKDCSFEYASFEDTLLDHCQIDHLDLTTCSCRAVRFKKCDISLFRTNLDKLMSTIGIYDLLSRNKFEIVNYNNSNKEIVSDINEVCVLIRERMDRLTTHGKLFEVLNFVLSFAGQHGLEKIVPNSQLEQLDYSGKLPADISAHRIFSAQDEGNQVYVKISQLIKRFMSDGVGVSLDSLLYSLRLILEYEIDSPQLYQAMFDLAQHLFQTQDREYMDNPTVALVQYYLIEMSKRIPTGWIQIRFTHKGINYSDITPRKDYLSNVDKLLECALPDGNYRFERVEHGSLDLVISTLDYRDLFCFLLAAGIKVKFKWKGKITDFSFKFDPARGIKAVAQLVSASNALLKETGLKGGKKDAEELAKSALERSKEYDGTSYFLENNISGDVKRVYVEEVARKEITRITEGNDAPKAIADAEED